MICKQHRSLIIKGRKSGILLFIEVGEQDGFVMVVNKRSTKPVSKPSDYSPDRSADFFTSTDMVQNKMKKLVSFSIFSTRYHEDV